MVSIYSLPPLIGAIFSIVLGGFVFLKDRKSDIHISFSLFCLSLFVWLFGYTVTYTINDEQIAVFFARISCTGAMFAAPSCYHFSVSYLNKKRERVIVWASYFIFLLIAPFSMTSDYFLSGVYKYHWGYYSRAGALHPLYLIIFFAVFIRSFWLLYCGYRERISLSPLKTNQIRYIFYGYITALMGAIDYVPKYGVEFYPFGFLFEIVFVSVIAYSIMRYRVMDINIVFKRTAAYSLAAGLLTGLFVVIVMTITNFLSSYAYVSSFKVSIFAAVVIALLFNPLRNRIQNIIDKIFYKQSYDYYSTVRKVSHELVSLFDCRKIYDFVGNIIFTTLGLKKIHLLAAVQAGSFEEVYAANKKGKHNRLDVKQEGSDTKLKINNRSGLVKYYKKHNDIIIKDELLLNETISGNETIADVKYEFEALQGEVSVPVFIDQKLGLLIILGEKMSGDMFSNEDLDLLRTISHQTAIALKNARLYQEKINSERLASVGMMSATFAHEIRNPLTSLKTFAQLMPEKYNDTEFREMFSKIVVGEIEKINGLITDLLDFSASKKSTRMNNFNLTELIDKIVDDVQGKLSFEKANITVQKKYNGDVINMLGDSGKLQQAFGNIILNGCQAMHGEGVLRVDIRPNGKQVDVAIEDTGEGIAAEDLQKIFDPFVTTKEMGVGLGLAISRRVIEDHNGKINVRSKPSRGTTFTVTLPIQNE
ncbi:MAG: hypothetical protein C4538_09875 [Nitrospiraceae bacterium]|nr:MAG: hypothetical protein C4538_09875 [Nitrospiraceae bacterium]